MFTLAMPQSEPAARKEFLGLLHVLREDAGRQPCGTPLCFFIAS